MANKTEKEKHEFWYHSDKRILPLNQALKLPLNSQLSWERNELWHRLQGVTVCRATPNSDLLKLPCWNSYVQLPYLFHKFGDQISIFYFKFWGLGLGQFVPRHKGLGVGYQKVKPTSQTGMSVSVEAGEKIDEWKSRGQKAEQSRIGCHSVTVWGSMPHDSIHFIHLRPVCHIAPLTSPPESS